MDYTNPQSLLLLFMLPCLFGLTLIGEGVNKIMNYDNQGWITVSIGSIFEVMIIIAYFMISANVS